MYNDITADFLTSTAHGLRTSLEEVLRLTALGDGGMKSASGNGGARQIRNQFQWHLRNVMETLEHVIFLTSRQTNAALAAQNTSSLDEVLKQAKIEAAEMCAPLGITIGALPGGLGTVAGDWVYLKKALVCLLEVAIKLSKLGSQIQIRGLALPEEVVLTIESKKGLLSRADLPRSFDLPADFAAGPLRDALGLTPVVAQYTISLLGGKVQARKVGAHGIQFQVFLPRLSMRPEPVGSPALSPIAGQSSAFVWQRPAMPAIAGLQLPSRSARRPSQ